MSGWNWEVTVITDSNYIKTVRVDNCNTRQDAEAAALGMTGAKQVLNSNTKTYKNDQTLNRVQEIVSQPIQPVYQEPEEDYEDFYNSLDEQELEMYDLMCQIAMEKEEELPTISEFYEYLGNNNLKKEKGVWDKIIGWFNK